MLIVSHSSQCFCDVFYKFIIGIDLDEIIVRKRTFEFYKNFFCRLWSYSRYRLKKRYIKSLYCITESIMIEMCYLKRYFRSYPLYFEHIQKGIFLTVSIECKIFDWFVMIIDDRMKKECSLFLWSFITYLNTNIRIGNIFIWSVWNTLPYNKMKHDLLLYEI